MDCRDLHDEPLGVIEALGLLRIAEHHVLYGDDDTEEA